MIALVVACSQGHPGRSAAEYFSNMIGASDKLPRLALVVPGGVVTGGLEHQLSSGSKLGYLTSKIKSLLAFIEL
jgi:hypothetical protein